MFDEQMNVQMLVDVKKPSNYSFQFKSLNPIPLPYAFLFGKPFAKMGFPWGLGTVNLPARRETLGREDLV